MDIHEAMKGFFHVPFVGFAALAGVLLVYREELGFRGIWGFLLGWAVGLALVVQIGGIEIRELFNGNYSVARMGFTAYEVLLAFLAMGTANYRGGYSE